MWVGACFLCAIAFLFASAAELRDEISYESRPFVFGYILFVSTICGSGLLTSHARLGRKQPGFHAAMTMLYLVGLGVFVFASLPRVPQAREAARRSQCNNNMKQIGLALFKFEEAHMALPRASAGDPPVSWRVVVLPFLDGKERFDQYDRALPWDDPKNELVAQRQFEPLMCPSHHPPLTDSLKRYFTDYVMLTGLGTVSPGDRDIRRRDLTDGATNTALVVEATGLNVVWTEPRDFDTARQPIGINLKGKEPKESPGMMSSYHRAGGHLLMGDGTVRFLNEKVDPRVLRKLTTIDGGEVFDE